VADATSDRERPGGAGGETLVRTFLLADIRGYTRYTREHGDEAASQLARRLASLVRSAVPEFGGELLEVRGDETLCVFTSARQALRAAIELQRRLRAPEEGEPFPVGVGMGLDAGEAVPTDGGFRGAALNMAGRLVSAAAPGEVLATERLVRLTGQVVGLHWSRPRSMRLKGLAEPELVVRVEADERIPPPPEQPRPPRRRRGAWMLAAIVCVVCVALAVVSGVRRSASAVHLRRDSIAVLDLRTGKVVADVPFTGSPGPILTGLGRVWVGDTTAQTLTSISPKTLRSDQRGIDVLPGTLAVNADSLLAYDGSTARGVSIDPATYQQTDFHVPQGKCVLSIGATGLCYLGGLAVGGGHIWAGTTNSETIWPLDRQQLTIDGPPIRNIHGDQLVWGLGRLWALGYLSEYLWDIEAHRVPVAKRYQTPVGINTGALPFAIGNEQVWVLDPAGSVVVFTPNQGFSGTIPMRPGLTNLVISGNWLWVTSGDGRLYKISLFTKNVAHIYDLHHRAEAVAIGFGRVWVSLSR
jgi:class 3 adenylate cyclase